MSNSGKCTWFNVRKGFGFITPDGCSDREDRIFVHHSGIAMDGFRKMRENDIVAYDIETDEQGRPKAVNVTKIEQ